METVDVTIALPRSILAAMRVRESELDSFLREHLAVDLYRERRISLAKAAEVAGVPTRWEMLALLAKHGVSLNYTADDAARDWQAVEDVLQP